MTSIIKTVIHYLISIGLLLLCLSTGKYIQMLLGTAIPSSIIGMLLLFVLMTSGIIQAKWVKPGASLLIRYMVLLFIPISVGLMELIDTLLEHAFSIFFSIIGSSLIVLVILGFSLDRLMKKGEQ